MERSSPSEVSEPRRQRSSLEAGSRRGSGWAREGRSWSLRARWRTGWDGGGLWDDGDGLGRGWVESKGDCT